VNLEGFMYYLKGRMRKDGAHQEENANMRLRLLSRIEHDANRVPLQSISPSIPISIEQFNSES